MDKQLLKDIEFSAYQLDNDQILEPEYYILFDEMYLNAQKEYISETITKEQFKDEFNQYVPINYLDFHVIEFAVKNHSDITLVQTYDKHHYKLKFKA